MSWLPVALLLGALLLSAAAGYWYWQHREFSLAADSLQSKRYEEALERADRLIAYGPDKTHAQELRALALLELQPDEAEQVIDESGETATPNVGIAYLAQSLKTGNFNRVDEVIENLGPTHGGDPDFLLLQAQIEARRGHSKKSFLLLDRLLTIDPKNSQAQLLKAKILLSKNALATTIQAKSHLRQAADSNGPGSSEALIILGTRFDIPLFENDRVWLLNKLREQKKQTPLSRLIATTQQMALEPDRRESLIAASIQQEGQAAPRLVARWLMTVGAYEDLIKFLQGPAAAELNIDQRWRGQMAAYLKSGNLEQASKLLGSDEISIDEVRRATLLAHIHSGMAAHDSPTESWRYAYTLADENDSFEELLSLAKLAQRQAWNEASIQAFERAKVSATDPLDEARMIPNYFTMLTQLGETRQALDLSRRYLELQPDSVLMLNNQYYLAALLGENNANENQRMAELVEKAPNTILPSTYAFMLWSSGQLEEAETQYSRLDQRFLKSPSSRLTGALIALDHGDHLMAAKLLEGFDATQLLPEETTLYQRAIQQIDQP